jgi:hypothetical protein
MPVELCLQTSTVVDNKIYITGGLDGDCSTFTILSRIYEYDPSLDLRPFVERMEADKTYARPGSDTILITTKMYDTTGMELFAVMKIGDQVAVDSVKLYDDGLHLDGDAGDSLYANIWVVSSTKEQYYYIDLHATCRGEDTIIHHMNNMAGFTTIGPIVFESYEFASADEIPQPGDRIKLYVTLKNNGATVSSTDIEAELISLDPLAEITELACCQNYDDIAPGAMIQSDRSYYIDISADCPVGKELPFELEINSGDYTYWKDTFSIMVQAPPDNIEDIKEPIARIYPNPATDQLTIEFDKKRSIETSIALFDITGKVVYSEVVNSAATETHTINLYSFAEGLYLIRISNNEYLYTEKVIKVE